MGARQDKSIPTKFHFGNALVELDHLIPREDEQNFVAFAAPSTHSSEIDLRLSQISMQLEELASVQSRLSFALRDIKRSIK